MKQNNCEEKMNLRDAAQQALEALEYVDGYNGWVYVSEEINALRAALAETQDWDEIEALRASLREHMAEIHRLRAAGRQALEALEEYQQKGAPFMSCDAAVVALRSALAEDVDSPAAYMMVNTTHGLSPSLHFTPPENWNVTWEAVPLYTAPPKRKPLTDEQIIDLFYGDSEKWWRVDHSEFCSIARAIERAHGIGGEE